MGGACSVVVVVVLLEVPLRGSSRIPDSPSMNALNKLGSSFGGGSIPSPAGLGQIPAFPILIC